MSKVVWLPLLFFVLGMGLSAQKSISKEQAALIAELPLRCIVQKYPYKPELVLNSELDLKAPVEHHPAFYGCYDWHSAVHGHWALAQLLALHPGLPQGSLIVDLLKQNLTRDNILREMEFFDIPNNGNFERPYGWAWLLKLHQSLKQSSHLEIQQLASHVEPLANLVSLKLMKFLPKLNYPIRSGEHTNTAFALILAWDYAVFVGNDSLKNTISQKAQQFYLADHDYPIHLEPGGFDFLSPALTEAALMARVLEREAFVRWFKRFVPGLYRGTWQLKPAVVSDRTDPKLVHLDGLNFSRAWCLRYIGGALGDRAAYFNGLANQHIDASLPYLTSGDYGGEHWLVSFAMLAME